MYEDNDANNIDCSECDIDSQNRIKLRLLEIQNQNDLDNLDLGFYERKIKMKSISLHQAQERFDVYKNISKLGLYIINDYEFFFKITIQSAFKNECYNTAMQNLGYQRSGSSWNLMWKPSQDVIIDFIYKYCYYAYIVAIKNNQKMKYNTPKREFNPKKNYNSEDNHHNRQNHNQAQPNYQERPNYGYKNENRYGNPKPYDGIPKKKPVMDQRTLPKKDNENDFNPDRPARKPENQTRKVELSKTIKCDICDFLNPIMNKACQVCAHPIVKIAKWHCPKCTFINEATSVNCDVCQHQNPRHI